MVQQPRCIPISVRSKPRVDESVTQSIAMEAPPRIIPVSFRLAEITFAAASIGFSLKLDDPHSKDPTFLLNITLAIAGAFAFAMLLCYLPKACYIYMHTNRANLLLQVVESHIFSIVILAAASVRASAITDTYGLTGMGSSTSMPPAPVPPAPTAPVPSPSGKSSSCLFGRVSDIFAMLTWLTFAAAMWYFASRLYMLRPPVFVAFSPQTSQECRKRNLSDNEKGASKECKNRIPNDIERGASEGGVRNGSSGGDGSESGSTFSGYGDIETGCSPSETGASEGEIRIASSGNGN